jgi:molecular chaperone DnaJ
MPAAKEDYYKTLGLEKGASEDEIRKSYRRLARKYHPDLNPGDKSAEDRFKQVQEAYDILSDKEKRQMYDQYGFYSPNGMPGGTPGAGDGPTPHMDFGGFDFSDFFSGASGGGGSRTETQSGGNFRDIFSGMFGGGRRGESAQPRPERGSDLEYALTIDFWQALRGTQIRLTINRLEVCDKCHGTGAQPGNNPVCPDCSGTGQVTQMAGNMRFNLTCPRCGGTGRLRNVCTNCQGEGRVPKQETVEVRIPPGVQSGARLRVPGKGNAGMMGAPPGDLFITVNVEPHPFFHRNGDNIEITVPVSVPEAGLGAKIEVPTVDGRALLKIPQGTQNGQKFRLREKGVFNTKKNARGDQIVEVVLKSPKVDNERTRELLRELAQVQTEDPRAEIWKLVEERR